MVKNIVDESAVLFHGAVIWAVFAIFPSRIWEAINSSQLRIWEKENGIVDRTECVAIKAHRGSCQRGTIILRLGFIQSMHITNLINDKSGH